MQITRRAIGLGAAAVLALAGLTAPSAVAPGAAIETWAGFPPMREKSFASRAALRTRVEALVERLAGASRGAS